MSKTSKTSTDEIFDVITTGMDDVLQEQETSFDGASPVDKGKAFTEFYVRNIARYMNNITDEDGVREGLECDAPRDLGMDFIYKKEDNEFWICQSKFSGKRMSLKKDTISDFFQIHLRIFEKEARHNANYVVQDLLSEINENSSITFVLLTSGKASDANQLEFERQRCDAGKRGKSDKYEWDLVDLHEIERYYNEISSSADENIKVSIEIPSGKERDEKGRYIELKEEISTAEKNYRTIVTVISGNILKDLFKKHKNALFNLNIRGFLGNNAGKNKKIRETLKDEPELFYLYNNGISAICTKMEIIPSGNKVDVECENFSIINGAQTAWSIRKFTDSEKLEKVRVLIRITEAKKIKSDEEFKRKIVEYNNTQNIIRDADFRSNDKVQVALQRRFSEKQYAYKGGKTSQTLEYARKRIERDGKKTILIEDMAKSLYAFNFAFGGKNSSQDSDKDVQEVQREMYPTGKTLFDGSDDGIYWKMFGSEKEMYPQKAKKFAAIVMLNIYLEDNLKKDAKDYKPDEAKGMAYRSGRHFLRSFGYIMRNFYSSEEQEDIFNKIINGTAFEPGKFVPVLYEKIEKAIRRTIRMEERLSKENGDGGFNFKSWLRSSKKVKHLTESLDEIKNDGELPKI